MLTFFTIPKPFHGHIAIIQRNAIQSWLRSTPGCEVILCGDEEGVAETANEFGVRHLGQITRNFYGTPLLGSTFSQVQQIARHHVICYVNTDIIFLSNLKKTVDRIPFHRFLMVGQRWDLDVNNLLDFQSNDWMMQLKEEIKTRGVLHPPAGSDYFVFPKGIIENMPDFTVGRPCWDNWVIYHARSLKLPAIDSTDAVTVIHQNHDYAHVPASRGDGWDGPEADCNFSLMGSPQKRFTLLDATWQLTPQRLVRSRTFAHLKRGLIVWPVLRLDQYPFFQHVLIRVFSLSLMIPGALQRWVRRHFSSRGILD